MGKYWKTKRESAAETNENALTMLLKPSSPTPANTGTNRSLHGDTEVNNGLRYCDILQRGGAQLSIPISATKAPHENSVAHSAQVVHHKESESSCNWSYRASLILPQIDHVQCYPPFKKLSPCIDYTVQKFKACIGSRTPHCRIVLQSGQDNVLKEQSPLNTPQDFFMIPSLCEAALETERRCFSKIILWNQMSLPIYQGHKTPSASTVPPIVNGNDCGCIVRDLETIIVLGLLASNFISQRSHHALTNLPEVTIQRLCNSNSNAWGWHNTFESGFSGTTDMLSLQDGKMLRRVQEEQYQA